MCARVHVCVRVCVCACACTCARVHVHMRMCVCVCVIRSGCVLLREVSGSVVCMWEPEARDRDVKGLAESQRAEYRENNL